MKKGSTEVRFMQTYKKRGNTKTMKRFSGEKHKKRAHINITDTFRPLRRHFAMYVNARDSFE